MTAMLPDADRAYAAGLRALDRPEAGAAIDGLRRVIRAHPRDHRLWHVLGLLHRADGDAGCALDSLARAAALRPDDRRVAFARAHCALEAGVPAVALFQSAARSGIPEHETLPGLAAALMAEGRGAAATAIVERALRRAPGWLDGHVLAARLRWLRGDRSGDVPSLRRALADWPADLRLHECHVAQLIRMRNWDAALAAIDAARRAAADSTALAQAEAICLTESGRLDAADAAFTRLGAPAAETEVYIARHLLRRGRPDRAAAFAASRAHTRRGSPLWPYLALAWRLTAPDRWHWLEAQRGLAASYDLRAELEDFAPLVARLRGLHRVSGLPLEQSVRNGTQTDGDLLSRSDPILRGLKAVLTRAVARHLAQLPPPDATHPVLGHARSGAVHFAGSWSVRLTSGGHHAPHTHPNGWFSSALHLVVPDAAGGGRLQLGVADPSLGLTLPPFAQFDARPGQLVLFPAMCWHATEPFADGERLTVAFDVRPPPH